MSKHDTRAALALATEIHAISGKLKRRLREQASAGDLTQSQLSVLGHLDRNGPTTVTALAALEAAGMVKGSPDPNDGRQTILSLTPACVALIRNGRAARTDWLLKTIQTRLTAQEQEQLAA